MRHRRSYPAFRHDPDPLPSLQLADHAKRIFEDPPAPTCSKAKLMESLGKRLEQ
jgi:hypothetical protein